MIPSSSHHAAGNAVASPTATATAAAAATSAGGGALSVSELRAGMQQFLRSSGALGSLKTQLRSVIVSELLRRRQGFSDTAAVIRNGREESDDDDSAWTQRLADALVENHLRLTNRTFSLAIFSSEADVSFGAAGDDALAGMLHFSTAATQRQDTSLFQRVVEMHMRQVGDSRGRPPGSAVGTQTDANDPTASSPPPLEIRLAAVDAKYALRFSQLGQSTREEVDRRMAAYRQELQAQMEQAYQQRLRAFEQQQLHEVRRAAEDHYGVLLQHKMEELREVERASVRRVESEQARLAQAREDLELQRVELDRRHRELQGLLEERDKATAALEGRLHDAKQQIRVLTAQAQQYEELCGVRLAEADAARDREWRRVEDLRRLQAEHVAELLLKDEEISRLRFRVKSLIGAHAVAGWRGEAEEGRTSTLRDVLEKAEELQQRVSAAMPPSAAFSTQPPQTREATWQSAWNLTRSPPPAAPAAATTTTGTKPATAVGEGELDDTVAQQQGVTPVGASVIQDVLQRTEEDEKRERVALATALPDSTSPVIATPPPSAASAPPDSPAAAIAVPLREVEETETRATEGGGDDESEERRRSAVKEETARNEKAPTSSSSPTHSKGSVDSTPKGHSSTQSSSSSPSSSASSPPSADKKAVTATAATATVLSTPASVFAEQNSLCREETSGRTAIEADEDTGRRGIAWAANSQRSVLLQRQADERDGSDDDGIGRRGIPSLGTFAASARQRQLTEEVAANTLFTRDSDDDVDSDILFGRRGSSDESF
ncbi:hypothetical protein DQ04_00011070 [Trypanosoma grayi]|uniref:hypothetical protein n=1 Tax=Trypanosoma grayi TaxID=71804 RepID=UPI0004F41EE6|nr:hypothetical protein DQ04_00011070 [Trypanosoma grayi]KEG15640.1 hypothetical protein DQ04_00011070 [Trypanosoma grayi]